jgi:hypothetical protein
MRTTSEEQRLRSDLKPKTLVRVLDRAFELYRANFKTIALSAAIVLLPLALLVSLAQVYYYRGIVEFVVEGIQQGAQGADPLAVTDDFMAMSMFSLVLQSAGPLYWMARVYFAACIFASGPRMLAGERPRVKEFLSPGLTRVLWVGLIWIVVGVLTNVGLIFFIVPGIIAAASLSVAGVTSVVERLTLPAAISRSWTLTNGNWWRIIGFWMILVTLAAALQAAASSPTIVRQIFISVSDPTAVFQPASTLWKTIEGTLAALGVVLAYPFTQLAWFSMYLDLRARREGMDLVARSMEIAEGDS